MTPSKAVIISSLAFFGISVLHCVIKKDSIRIKGRTAAGLLVTGGLGMGLTTLLLTISYQYIPVGCATVIHFMYPSLVCMVMVLFFKEPLTCRKIGAMVSSVVGIMLISGGVFHNSLLGIVLALGSSLTYTFYIVMIDRWEGDGLPLEVRLFYLTLGCLMVSLICGSSMEGAGQRSLYSTAIVIMCGAMSFGAAFLFAASVKRIGASKAAFFSLFEPITSLVVSTILYHYSFSVITVLGCALAISAILLTCMDDREKG